MLIEFYEILESLKENVYDLPIENDAMMEIASFLEAAILKLQEHREFEELY